MSDEERECPKCKAGMRRTETREDTTSSHVVATWWQCDHCGLVLLPVSSVKKFDPRRAEKL